MAAGKYDLTIDQGSSFALDMTVQEDNTAKNLTGYSVRAQLRPTQTSSTLTANFTGTVVNATAGTANTGGGGGGNGPAPSTAGSGGSGVVIIRYKYQ